MKATLKIELTDDTHWLITVSREHEGQLDGETFKIPVVISTRDQAVHLAFALGQIAGLVHYHDFDPDESRSKGLRGREGGG